MHPTIGGPSVPFDTRIAFVADDGPHHLAVQALQGIMPAKLRVFRTNEMEAAKDWLAA